MYLTTAVWNNAIDRKERGKHWSNRCLFVPEIASLTQLSDIQQGSEIVFSCIDQWKLLEKTWLQYLYKRSWQVTHHKKCNKTKNIYIMDNHNYALWCWSDSGVQWWVNHIDQHADLAEPLTYISPHDLETSEWLRQYTITQTQVWSFIKPALKANIITHCEQIRSVYALEKTTDQLFLDIDCDFFVGMDIKERSYCYWYIEKLWRDAQCITIATSPAFMKQADAMSVLDTLLDMCIW